MNASLLHDIVDGEAGKGAFALLFRPQSGAEDMLDVFTGDMSQFDTLDAIPLSDAAVVGEDVLVLVPYAQLHERGFACIDDDERLQVMTIRKQQRIAIEEALQAIPDASIEFSGGEFDVDDEAYGAKVRRIIAEEIGRGEGSNFVIKRTFYADITAYSLRVALAAFRRLVQDEVGAYWTFIVHTGERTFIGASPERQVTLRDGVATMNPISGTYRYPASGPTLSGVMGFLSDAKEKDELYMVVDEELKMMAPFCPQGGKVIGPYLKEMSRLAHTEYFIEGRTSSDPRKILRDTLLAPTVTGSPIENACRIIARHEPEGRGYYGGVAALIGRDPAGQFMLDSAILIRTADINAHGRMRIGVGATIVRHSDPESEAAETRAKAKALLAALGYGRKAKFGLDPGVQAALKQRNGGIADFWLSDAEDRIRLDPALRGRKVLMVDAEDAFTGMLAQQLTAIGLDVTMCRFDDPALFERHWDLAVLGPGPGDPRNMDDPRIASLRRALTHLLAEKRAFFAVCLSHQILCLELGLELIQRKSPNQGVQQEIDFFGAREVVGFYNTYVARCDRSQFNLRGNSLVEVSRDAESNEVHALRGPGFASIQFHAESLLTRSGVDIIASSVKRVLVT
ncbi:anthranilate synthase family protein [Dyella tabacisoli]|uniref:anthranilate synthase n=1 Tax=Dyella tabacisoli TaxID=2282381 RepID=A0A369UGH9_9GAMM|nr:anthranilate synthase family protein [Dyella tabacisoli]RDD79834.1 phenazine-specific anthranilate synthase component I [Dyella tabacisoli]